MRLVIVVRVYKYIIRRKNSLFSRLGAADVPQRTAHQVHGYNLFVRAETCARIARVGERAWNEFLACYMTRISSLIQGLLMASKNKFHMQRVWLEGRLSSSRVSLVRWRRIDLIVCAYVCTCVLVEIVSLTATWDLRNWKRKRYLVIREWKKEDVTHYVI